LHAPIGHFERKELERVEHLKADSLHRQNSTSNLEKPIAEIAKYSTLLDIQGSWK
jgi:hypothetical protein